MTPRRLLPRVPDSVGYTYSTMARHCGGSHTLTYPYRRNRPQHLPQGLCAPEEIQIAMKVRQEAPTCPRGHISLQMSPKPAPPP